MSITTPNAPFSVVKPALFPDKAKRGKVYKDIASFKYVGLPDIKIVEPRTSKPRELFVIKYPAEIIKPGRTFDVEVMYKPLEDANEALGRASIIVDFDIYQDV